MSLTASHHPSPDRHIRAHYLTKIDGLICPEHWTELRNYERPWVATSVPVPMNDNRASYIHAQRILLDVVDEKWDSDKLRPESKMVWMCPMSVLTQP